MARCLRAGIALAIPLCQAQNACLTELQKNPHVNGVPSWLLYAVALTESGRDINGHKLPWPWTVNVQGKGYFFRTKAEAIAAVRKFQRQGITCIDVGCMQINLKFHPHAFPDLETAFDPKANIRYAARFLNELKDRHGAWQKAVSHYHSALPRHGAAYLQKVMKYWQPMKNMFQKMLRQGHVPGDPMIGQQRREQGFFPASHEPVPYAAHNAVYRPDASPPTVHTVPQVRFVRLSGAQDMTVPRPLPAPAPKPLAAPPQVRDPAMKSRRIRATFVPTADLMLQNRAAAQATPLPKLGDAKGLQAVTAVGSLQRRETRFISFN